LAFVILLHLFALAKSLTSERPAEPEEPPRSGGDEREFACYLLARPPHIWLFICCVLESQFIC